MAPIAISPSESQVDMHSQKNLDMERRDSTSPLQGVGGRKMPQRKRTIDMNDGNEIPQIALGVYKAPNGQETEDAIIAALEREDAPGRTYELGGPRIYSFRELLAWILHETRRHRALIDIPHGLAGLQARLGELVPGKPFTRDQLLLLQRDNVAAPGTPGLAELGIVPTPIELIVPEYLDRYRPGGGRREEAPA